jgi:hypothetical protein
MVASVRPSCRRSQVMWDGATQATDFFFQSETNQHPSCVEAQLNCRSRCGAYWSSSS